MRHRPNPSMAQLVFVGPLLFVIHASLSSGWAQTRLAEPMPKTLSHSDSVRMNLSAHGLRRGSYPYLPIVESLEVEDAPLEAIGKLTVENDENAQPVCTATLILADVIITAKACITEKKATFFWPASTNRKRSPYGSAAVKFYWGYAEDRGSTPRNNVVFGLLDRLLIEIPTFSVRQCPVPYPNQWMNKNYWLLAGYLQGNWTPQLQSGCRVITQSGDGTNSPYDLFVRCRDEFLPGAILFGNLCGEMTITGIKTVGRAGQLESSNNFWLTLQQALGQWSYQTLLKDSTRCLGASFPVVRGNFLDDEPSDSLSR